MNRILGKIKEIKGKLEWFCTILFKYFLVVVYFYWEIDFTKCQRKIFYFYKKKLLYFYWDSESEQRNYDKTLIDQYFEVL